MLVGAGSEADASCAPLALMLTRPAVRQRRTSGYNLIKRSYRIALTDARALTPARCLSRQHRSCAPHQLVSEQAH